MLSILDIAREEVIKQGCEGEWSTELAFITSEGEEFTVRGLATVHSQGFDSNGVPVISENAHINFSEKTVNDLGIQTRVNGVLIIEGWKVTFTLAIGTITAILSRPEPDKTFGIIRATLTEYEFN